MIPDNCPKPDQVVQLQPWVPSPPPPPEGGTRLIMQSGDLQKYTPWRQTDVRTAITRGLKEYLEQLKTSEEIKTSITGGTDQMFKTVKQTWAEPEVMAQYPSACVYAPSQGNYDDSALASSVFAFSKGNYLKKWAEYELDVIVDVYTNDPMSRMAITGMLEEAFNPTDFMAGFILELPHYFNARAIFELQTSQYIDDMDSAQKRLRRVQFQLFAVLEVLQFRGEIPFITPLVDSDALE